MIVHLNNNNIAAENEDLKTSLGTMAAILAKRNREIKALKEENAKLRRELGNIRFLETPHTRQ